MEQHQRFLKQWLLLFFCLFSTLGYSQVSPQWMARFNGPANGSDLANALTVDAAGNVYITGMSQGTTADYVTIKYDPGGLLLWAKTYNGTGNGGDEAKSIAVDAAGNVYITGQSEGIGFFNFDYATIKYDADGNELWVSRYDGPGIATDIATAIAIDDAGNVYVTGSSYGSSGNTDYATIRYDSDGSEIWVQRYNGPGNSHDGAYALALGAGGKVHVTGYSHGTGTAEDYATIQYSCDGLMQWAARYNGAANSLDQAFDLKVDATGNVYVTGQSFEAGAGSAYATVKYDPSGTEQWASRYHPGTGSDVARALAVDLSGNVYVTGSSNLTNSDFGDDFATLKYSAAGVLQWEARYDGPDSDIDQAHAVALDAASNVYVTGMSDQVGPTFTHPDYATVKYNNSGTQLWAVRYDGLGGSTDIAADIAVDATGAVYITGFSGGDATGADAVTIKYLEGLAACGKNKVLVCHRGKTLCIAGKDAQDHLDHGDQPGACIPASITQVQTGIRDQQLLRDAELKISHFPNPGAAAVMVQYKLPVGGRVSLHVFDVLGRQVVKVTEGLRVPGTHTGRLDISALPAGTYYCRITLSAAGRIWVKTSKIVVAR